MMKQARAALAQKTPSMSGADEAPITAENVMERFIAERGDLFEEFHLMARVIPDTVNLIRAMRAAERRPALKNVRLRPGAARRSTSPKARRRAR